MRVIYFTIFALLIHPVLGFTCTEEKFTRGKNEYLKFQKKIIQNRQSLVQTNKELGGVYGYQRIQELMSQIQELKSILKGNQLVGRSLKENMERFGVICPQYRGQVQDLLRDYPMDLRGI